MGRLRSSRPGGSCRFRAAAGHARESRAGCLRCSGAGGARSLGAPGGPIARDTNQRPLSWVLDPRSWAPWGTWTYQRRCSGPKSQRSSGYSHVIKMDTLTRTARRASRAHAPRSCCCCCCCVLAPGGPRGRLCSLPCCSLLCCCCSAALGVPVCDVQRFPAATNHTFFSCNFSPLQFFRAVHSCV